MNPDVDYSVVYTDEKGDSIISSRRWEAFKLGFEDYSVISAYAAKFGKQKAKDLVAEVLSKPGDINLADSVIHKMVAGLSVPNKN